jgi:hypothetical protein
MTFAKSLLRCASLGLALLISPAAAKQVLLTQTHENNDPNKPILRKAVVDSVFTGTGQNGFLTLVTEVENNTDEAFQLTLRLTDKTEGVDYSVEEVIAAPPRKTGKTISYLMLPPALGINNYRYGGGYNREVEISGGGLNDRSNSMTLDGDKSAVALSKTLTDGRVEDFNRSARASAVAEFVAAELPADWRAFHTFGLIGMSAKEWQSLTPGVQDALIQYVKLGGRLRLYVGLGTAWSSLRIPSAPGNLGLGSLLTQDWDEKPLKSHEVDADQADSYRTGRFDNENSRNSRALWMTMLSDLGERDFGAWLVAIVLLVFALLVGPINLFKLAPKGRRHRLFITTPIISLGAAAVLGLTILVQDGLGGSGTRMAVAFLDAQDHALYTAQSEISRTGLLVKSGFEVNESAYVAPALLSSGDRWTRLKKYGNGNEQKFIIKSGKQFEGDFFQSRSLQGLGMEYARPTRARIELGGAAQAPTLQSSFDFTIQTLFLYHQGEWWIPKSQLTAGKTVELEKTATLSSNLQAVLGPYGKLEIEGRFYAVVSEQATCDSLLHSSLSSIKWADQRVWLFGDTTKQAAQP